MGAQHALCFRIVASNSRDGSPRCPPFVPIPLIVAPIVILALVCEIATDVCPPFCNALYTGLCAAVSSRSMRPSCSRASSAGAIL